MGISGDEGGDSAQCEAHDHGRQGAQHFPAGGLGCNEIHAINNDAQYESRRSHMHTCAILIYDF